CRSHIQSAFNTVRVSLIYLVFLTQFRQHRRAVIATAEMRHQSGGGHLIKLAKLIVFQQARKIVAETFIAFHNLTSPGQWSEIGGQWPVVSGQWSVKNSDH